MTRYIVAVGEKTDQYFYGPFDSMEEATTWADDEQKDGGLTDGELVQFYVLNLP